MTPLIIISDFLNRPTLILCLGFFLYRLLEPLQEKPDYSPLEVIKHLYLVFSTGALSNVEQGSVANQVVWFCSFTFNPDGHDSRWDFSVFFFWRHPDAKCITVNFS